MVKGNLEQFVRRLFSDQSFRTLALENVNGALSEYGLTRTEQAAARKVCGQLVTPEGFLPSPTHLWF